MDYSSLVVEKGVIDSAGETQEPSDPILVDLGKSSNPDAIDLIQELKRSQDRLKEAKEAHEFKAMPYDSKNRRKIEKIARTRTAGSRVRQRAQRQSTPPDMHQSHLNYIGVGQEEVMEAAYCKFLNEKVKRLREEVQESKEQEKSAQIEFRSLTEQVILAEKKVKKFREYLEQSKVFHRSVIQKIRIAEDMKKEYRHLWRGKGKPP